MNISSEAAANEPRMWSAMFTAEDVCVAIKDCNFDKAIGCDGFDGRILNKSEEVTSKLSTLLC